MWLIDALREITFTNFTKFGDLGELFEDKTSPYWFCKYFNLPCSLNDTQRVIPQDWELRRLIFYLKSPKNIPAKTHPYHSKMQLFNEKTIFQLISVAKIKSIYGLQPTIHNRRNLATISRNCQVNPASRHKRDKSRRMKRHS